MRCIELRIMNVFGENIINLNRVIEYMGARFFGWGECNMVTTYT